MNLPIGSTRRGRRFRLCTQVTMELRIFTNHCESDAGKATSVLRPDMLRITSRREWVGHCLGWARPHARESPRRLVPSRKTLVAPGCHLVMRHRYRPLLIASCTTSDMNTPCCKRARVPAKSAMKPAWRARASRIASTSSRCVITVMATSVRGSGCRVVQQVRQVQGRAPRGWMA